MSSLDTPAPPTLVPVNDRHPGQLTWAALSQRFQSGQPSSSGLYSMQSKDRRSAREHGISRSSAHQAAEGSSAFAEPGVPASQPPSPSPAARRLPRLRRASPPLLSDNPLDPEIYRQIFTSLELPDRESLAVIGITSAIRGEGRTTIALGLATTLALNLDVPVTLVEADMERPCLADLVCGSPAPGLVNVLREEYQLHEVVYPLPAQFGTLSLIPAGKATKNVSPLLRHLAMHDPFRGLQGLTGLVILDLPPIVNSSFGALTASLADAIVLVVRAGVTPQKLLCEAIARLEEHPPQGVVFNAFQSAIPRWWPGRQW